MTDSVQRQICAKNALLSVTLFANICSVGKKLVGSLFVINFATDHY